VRYRGGRTQTLSVAIPLNAWQRRRTDPRIVAEMDRLLDEHTDGQVAAILRERGMSTPRPASPSRPSGSGGSDAPPD
jgi:hypothetical protein